MSPLPIFPSSPSPRPSRPQLSHSTTTHRIHRPEPSPQCTRFDQTFVNDVKVKVPTTLHQYGNFDIILRPFLTFPPTDSSIPPHVRGVCCASRSAGAVSGADWCLQSDVVAHSRLFFSSFLDLGLIRGGSRYDTIRFGVTRASYRFERITEPQAGTAAAAARAASPKPESSEPGRWTEEVIELPRRGGSHGSSDHRRHELQRTRRRRPVAAVTADRGAAARRPPLSSPRGRRVSFEVEGNGNGDGSGSGHASGTYDEESGSDQGDVFSEDSLGSCDDAEEAAWASPAPRAAQYHRPSRYDSPLPQPALVPPPSGRRQKPLRYDDDHGARARPRSGRARHDGYHERRHDQHDDHRDHNRDRDREHRPSSSSRPRSRREARPPSPRESGGGGSPSSRRRTAERPPRPPERPRSSRRNIRGGASTVLPSRAPTDRPAAGFRRASTVVQQHQQSTPVKHRFQPPKKSVAYDMLCGNFDVISDHSSRIFF